MHAVAAGQAPGRLVPLLYEVADARDLPDAARGRTGSWCGGCGPGIVCMSLMSRSTGQPTPTSVAILGACRSARDRLIVLLMARAGLRRGEVLGLRRSDVHLLLDSGPLGCAVARAHVHCGAPRRQRERGGGKSPAAGRASGFRYGAGV